MTDLDASPATATAVVLYPSPAVGHLISMVELGKLILAHRPSINLHILLSSKAYKAGPTDAYINSVITTFPSITFHRLPVTSLPPDFTPLSPHHEALALELMTLNNPHVRQSLRSIATGHRVLALVIDFFCYVAHDVARELSIPCYYFFTSAASVLAYFLYTPTLHVKYPDDVFHDPETLLDIPGIPPMPTKLVAIPIKDRRDICYHKFLDSSINMRKSDGVIVNTFENIERQALRAIRDGLCVPGGLTPPVFPVGPLIGNNGNNNPTNNNGKSVPESIRWLDRQPALSVVFLCFGSLGAFSVEQLGEIAIGLERSGQRFLWVVRDPPPDPARPVSTEARCDPDLETLLPEGFLGRTKDRALVVQSWVPQVAVLNHGSTGGFVTHSGWNSVLEAVCAGVPMISWPLYAEQGHNKVFMVEEMKIALPMEESEEAGLVTAAEVERRVRELVDSKVGKAMRDRMARFRDEAKATMGPDGSSRAALAGLVESWAGTLESNGHLIN